jgi:hypothetical protein
MRARTRCWFRSITLGLAVLSAGCSRQTPNVQIEKTRPLPEVSAGDQNFSAYKPAHAFIEIAPAVLTRTVFQGPGPAGFRIEVRDLQLAAHKSAGDLTLPGAAFAEVRYGAGTMTAGEKHQELALGTTLSISQGQRFSLESTSDQPLIIRVHLLTAE